MAIFNSRSRRFPDRTGQTLVEVMVALFVLVVGFLGILSLLAQSIYITKTITNETTATYLAAEGIEVTKNIIDHDIYQQRFGASGTGWGFGGVDPTFNAGGNFQVDYETCDNQSPCLPMPLYTGSPLLFDPLTDLYGYESGSPTPFTREITVTPNGVNELTVQSTVRWQAGLVPESVTLEDHFYNWYPAP